MHQFLLQNLAKKCTNGLEKVSQFKWLGKKGNLPLSYFPHRWPLGTYEQRWRVFKVVKSMELVMKFQAIHIGKTIIENKQMWRVDSNSLQRVSASQVMMDVMQCFMLNYLNDEHADFFIIIDHENELDRGLSGPCGHIFLLWHRKTPLFSFWWTAKHKPVCFTREVVTERFIKAHWKLTFLTDKGLSRISHFQKLRWRYGS